MLADSYYTPERIDQILRQWPAYESRAEGYRSPMPDALRPSKGPVLSGSVTSAICADISQAMVSALEVGSVGWRTVTLRRCGWSFGMMGRDLHMAKQSAWEQYQKSISMMARVLGWIEEDTVT